MPHRQWAIRVALAAGLAATALAVPGPAPATPAEPSPVEVAPAGVPAVTLLSGAAPSTVTVPYGDAPTAISTNTLGAHICGEPCPPGHPDWTPAATFVVLKQPHPSVELHAAEQAGMPFPALLRLLHVRPRSTLPTGRSTHLDPRPA